MIKQHLQIKIVDSPIFWSVLFNLSIIINLFNFYTLDLIYAGLFGLGALMAISGKLNNFCDAFYLTRNPFNILLAIFCSSGVVGYLIASPMSKNQWSEILELRWVFGFYACYFLGRQLKNTNASLNLSSSALLVAVFYLLYHHWTQFGIFLDPDSRLQGFYQNANHLALTLVLLIAFLIGRVSIPQNANKSLFIDFITLSIFGVAILATYSRSSWAGSVAAFIFALFYARNKTLKISALILTTTMFILLLVNAFGVKDRLLYTLDMSASGAQEMRMTAWKVNWQIFLDHPLFGVGFAENARLYPEYYRKLGFNADFIVGNAHNQYLEILSGAGALGLLSYMGIFITAYIFFHHSYKITNNLNRKRIALSALLIIVALMVSSLTDTPMRLHESRNYLMILLGVSLGYLSNNTVSKHTLPNS
ncbi:O-antigen ligase family protein [Bdellovibrio bacteriovorus]|uniref:O-antigen ligase family protein n=1 Tax=Bdellovibrio bacteriovorus TaxID=959 RepID=UPI0035A9206C